MFVFRQPKESAKQFSQYPNTEDQLQAWGRALQEITPDEYFDEVGHDISFSGIRGMVLAPHQLTKYGVALTEAAKSKAQELYAEAIKKPEISSVVIRTGPTASGKTTATRALSVDSGFDGTLVYEDHLDSLDDIVMLVNEARAEGLGVEIQGFYREPHEAFTSVMERAKETGKIVPVDYAAETYRAFEANWPKLVSSLQGKRGVTLSLFDNSQGAGNAQEIEPGNLPQTNTTNLERDFQDQLDSARKDKAISSRLYDQFNQQRGTRV